MSLQIQAQKLRAFTPAEDMAGKKMIARKAGKIHVTENGFKKRHVWMRICEFVSASRGPSVMAKAAVEARHYAQAAVIRKSHRAHQIETESGQKLSKAEFDDLVWNSNGVQKRIMREDFIRFNGDHYSEEAGASLRNRIAHGTSRFAHTLHGLCEMNAAPTGMTSNVVRDIAIKKPGEQSTMNKVFMLGSLGFIGAGTTELISWLKDRVPESLKVFGKQAGEQVGGVIMAFAMVSSAMGALGSFFGWTSQAIVGKQKVSDKQISFMNSDLNISLQKLVFRLKSVNSPEVIKMMGSAMKGRRFLLKKVSGNALEHNGIPKILLKALNTIDRSATDTENMKKLVDMAGEYLQVPNKPEKKNASLWSRYAYARAVKVREREWVALLGLVEHAEIAPVNGDITDLRKAFEDKVIPDFHNWILKRFIPVARFIDKAIYTNMAPSFEKWTSPYYKEAQKIKNSGDLLAHKRAYTGEYMVKHRHQYGPVTRCFITLAEGMRLFNMSIVLASNANLSRGYNNSLYLGNELIGTSPASRTICNSTGRFFGGASLALIFGLGIPALEAHTGTKGSVDVDVGTSEKLTLSAKNIGYLMCIVAAPTLLFQGIAQLSARLEGWKGNTTETFSSRDKQIRW